MYFYIVDPQKLNQKTFDRVQNHLYSSLSEHRISGEVSRVTSIRSVSQLVDIAFTRDVKTLVAVGSDETLEEVINALKGREVTLGFIPLMDTELGRIFGLPDIDTAAKTIASRRIENIDLGLVNNTWFLTKLQFGEIENTNKGFLSMFGASSLPTFEIKFSADGKYHGTVQAVAGSIVNARDNSCGHERIANPTDSVLDVLLLPHLSSYQMWQYKKQIQSGCLETIPGSSTIHLKRIEITNPEGMPLMSSGKTIAKTPAIVEVLPKALKMIVGKDRTF